jgi:uncharacterized protein (DUF488 family)
MSTLLWTIGHSTRPIDEFLKLLQAHNIESLMDVRTIPGSRHNPQFNIDALAQSLAAGGISYQHAPNLGGLRKPKKDSLNQGWRNASFRGYADYMQSEEFGRAIDELTADSRQLRTAIMCAEAVPWRCHRSLIADALIVNGWEIRHIMSGTRTDVHRLTPFAIQHNRSIRYPDPDATPRLL